MKLKRALTYDNIKTDNCDMKLKQALTYDNIKKANQAKVDFNRALHLFPPKKSNWEPKA